MRYDCYSKLNDASLKRDVTYSRKVPESITSISTLLTVELQNERYPPDKKGLRISFL
uniref:Uncharacterized protein n=1 Tax=Anguilla anguilla TaxID=7936 RepID=A0A0E9WC35_ANGAN